MLPRQQRAAASDVLRFDPNQWVVTLAS